MVHCDTAADFTGLPLSGWGADGSSAAMYWDTVPRLQAEDPAVATLVKPADMESAPLAEPHQDTAVGVRVNVDPVRVPLHRFARGLRDIVQSESKYAARVRGPSSRQDQISGSSPCRAIIPAMRRSSCCKADSGGEGWTR